MGSGKHPITFITWLWKGWRDVYNERHVMALRRMLQKFGPDHRLLVVSDRELALPDDVIVYSIWKQPIQPGLHVKQNCFARLKLFDPDFGHKLGNRLVSIDLDVLIQDDISPLFETFPDFRAVAGVSSYYNGSMWEMRPGTNAHVWSRLLETYPREVIRQIEKARHGFYRPVNGSDQAWLSMHIEDGELWTLQDGVLHYSEEKLPERRHNLRDARMICFAGGTKPWDYECNRVTPNIHEQYMKYYNA